MSSTITKSQQQNLPKSEASTIIIGGSTRNKPPTTTQQQQQQQQQHQQQQQQKSAIIRKKLDEKREHFTRTSSIERLKRFNSFICSQHYFILPIVLCCLRSSKTILQTTFDSCIRFVKESLFAIYKFRINDNLIIIINKMKFLFAIRQNSMYVLYKTTKQLLFTLCVYTTLIGIFLQLFFCLYLLSLTFLPFGFIFLCTCIYLISQLNFNVLLHMSLKEELINVKLNQMRTSRKDNYLNNVKDVNDGCRRIRGNVIKPKQILCNRTISNVNLF